MEPAEAAPTHTGDIDGFLSSRLNDGHGLQVGEPALKEGRERKRGRVAAATTVSALSESERSADTAADDFPLTGPD
jgi:hypothetical protein